MRKYLIISILAIILIGIAYAQTQTIEDIEHHIKIADLDKWTINITGPETYLDVYYIEINDTATQFCLRPNNAQQYLLESTLTGKDIAKVPITLLSNNATATTNTLNIKTLKKDQDACFILHHPHNTEGIKLKIGWESVEIDGSGNADATGSMVNNLIVKDSTGRLHVTFLGSGNDLWYANSSNNGTTWTKMELATDAYFAPNMLIYENDTIEIVAVTSPFSTDLMVLTSTDYGTTWNSITWKSGIIGGGSSSCVLDSNERRQCIVVSASSIEYMYNDSTTTTVCASVNDCEKCDIAIAPNGCKYVTCIANNGDDLYIMGDCLNGYGIPNSVKVHASTADLNPAIAIDSLNNIFITWTEASDLWVANSSDNGTTWTTQEIDTSSSIYPTMVINEDDDIYIFYLATVGSNMFIANSSNHGETWYAPRRTFEVLANYPAVGAGDHIRGINLVTNRIDYLITDTGNDINYANITIPYTGGSEEDTTPPQVTITSPTNATYNINNFPLSFNVSLDEAGDTVLYSFNNFVTNYTMDEITTTTFGRLNTSMTDGTYTMNIFANDTFGNHNNTESVTFSIVNYGISDCMNITQQNTAWTILNDMLSQTTCIYIKANNVTIHGDNYLINFSTADTTPDLHAGINIYGINNSLIHNLRITTPDTTDGTLAIWAEGIYSRAVADPLRAVIENITIIGTSDGLDIEGQHHKIKNITLNSINQYNIVNSNSYNLTFTDITATTAGSQDFSFTSANNTIFTRYNSTGVTISIFGSSDTGRNITFIDSNLGGIIDAYNNIEITLINTTYSNTATVSGTGNITQQWYITTFVHDSTQTGVSSANMNITDSRGNITYSETTDGSGYTQKIAQTEWVNISGTTNLHTDHTIQASKTGYEPNSTTETLTTNLIADLLLIQNDPCITTINQDWVIGQNTNCTYKNINLGTGSLNITCPYTLFFNESNITAKAFNIQGTGCDLLWFSNKLKTNTLQFNVSI